MLGATFGLTMAARALLRRAEVLDDQLDGSLGQLAGERLAHRPAAPWPRRAARCRGEAHVDLVDRLVDLRERTCSEVAPPPSRCRGRGRARSDHDRPAERQDVAERVRVALGGAVDERPRPSSRPFPCSEWPRKIAARHRRHRHADEVRLAIIATPTVSASGANSFFARPASRSTGRSTAIVVKRRREHRERHRVRAFERRLSHAHAVALVVMDRLEHHDRVVDEAPHREGETAEGERVERLPRRVEDDERDGERERNGHRDDQRAAEALQERRGSRAPMRKSAWMISFFSP